MKIYLISSEENNKFGISKVINQLKKKFAINNKIKRSKNLVDFILFKPNILHIHGCWKVRLIIFFLLAKFMKVKIIISPHGMMDQNSLNRKKFRKKIALFLYQKFMFKNSDLIIVNSEVEKRNFIKQISNFKKLIIISHGIDIDKKFFPKKNLNKELKFVFFSKIHDSKNLDTLLSLWEKSIFLKKFNLDIFGEIDDKPYFSRITQFIYRNRNIKYLGSLNNKIHEKLSTYDVFIHPSKSENFGLVIYEALSSGLFLILNNKLKKNELQKSNFAMNINLDLKHLEKSIQLILTKKSYIKSLAYKKRCFYFIKKNYNWNIISKKYLQKYNDLI